MSQHWENQKQASTREERATGRALLRGWRNKCPRCGEGRMFNRFLKTEEPCGNCGLEMHHHRADDFPPYLTVTLIAHIVVPGMLVLEKMAYPPMWVHWIVWIPLTLVLTALLMQPVKGAIIGWQWGMAMHGFGVDDTADEADSPDGGVTAHPQ